MHYRIFLKYEEIIKKKVALRFFSPVKNLKLNIESPNWVFCDTCSDRLLFKEIKKSLNTEKINY